MNGHDVNGHDRSRVLGDAIRAVASAARRVGPALRSRRRGVEAIAYAWSRARRRAEEDHDEALERLAKRSERAANGGSDVRHVPRRARPNDDATHESNGARRETAG